MEARRLGWPLVWPFSKHQSSPAITMTENEPEPESHDRTPQQVHAEPIRVCATCLSDYIYTKSRSFTGECPNKCEFRGWFLSRIGDVWTCECDTSRDKGPTLYCNMTRGELDKHLVLHTESERIIREGAVIEVSKIYGERSGTWFEQKRWVLKGRTVYCSARDLPQDMWGIDGLRRELSSLYDERDRLAGDLELDLSTYGQFLLLTQKRVVEDRIGALEIALPDAPKPESVLIGVA